MLLCRDSKDLKKVFFQHNDVVCDLLTVVSITMNPVLLVINGLKDATGTFGKNLQELLSNTVEDGPVLIPRQAVTATLSQYRVLLVGLFSLLVPYVAIQLLCWCCSRNKRENSRSLGGKSYNYMLGDTDADRAATGRHLVNAAYEAKRWFRQAEHDLDAARHDMDQTDPAYEWACFKCHQAAEKAVKSSLLHHRQQFEAVHDLSELSLHTQDRHLISLCKKIQNTLGFTGRMRYPDFLAYPKIPHDVHTAAQAQNGWLVSHDLLEYIRRALRLPARTQTTDYPPGAPQPCGSNIGDNKGDNTAPAADEM